MSEMYFEAGGCTDSVMVEAFSGDERFVLSISGPHTISYIKNDQILQVSSGKELFDLIMNKVWFEEMEGALDTDLDVYSVGSVMEYLRGVEDTADNPLLSSLWRIERNVNKFWEEVEKMDSVDKVLIHQIHAGSDDFTDYLNIPYEEDEEETRNILIERLSDDSMIDSIMEHFEEGEFYIDSYECEELMEADLKEGKVTNTVSVTEIQ